jgi:hypothetical protein
MLGIIAVLLVICILGLIVAKPKLGTFIIWPILFAYPHNLFFGLLPLNMGVDDLFCVFLFFTVFLRRNLTGGVRPRIGYAFWVMTGFVIFVAVANFSGMLQSEIPENSLYVKEVLKAFVFWGLFYAVLHCIDDERDIRIQFTMFSLAAVLGAVLVILSSLFPYQMQIFSKPETFTLISFSEELRGAGAFINPNAAACVLACSLVMVVTAIRLQKTLFSKMMIYAFSFILLIGVLYTESRSGLLALVGAFATMSVVGRSKKVALLVIGAAVVVSIVFAGLYGFYAERVQEAYDPTTGAWGRNVLGRLDTWQSYFETATTENYIFGQGPRQGIIKNAMESHSAYVSLITVYGLGAVIWALASVTFFFRKVWQLRRCTDDLLRTVAEGCAFALIAWGIYASSADAITSQYARYLLFYIVVLLDRAAFFAKEQQEWALCESEEDLEAIYPEQGTLSW